MEGINEATQVLNVTINGASTALRLLGSFTHFSGHELKVFLKFIAAKHKENQLKPEKMLPGETDIHEFMRVADSNNESVGCMTIDNSIKDKFIAYANEHKLSFSTLYQLGTGETTFLYSGSQEYAFKAFIMSEDKARASSISDYTGDISLEDQIRVDKLMETPKAYLDKFNAVMNEENMEKQVALDQSQIVGQNEHFVELSLKDDEDNMAFAKVPKDAIRYDRTSGAFVLSISNAAECKITSEPSIITYPDGTVSEKVVPFKNVNGDKIRDGVTKKLQDIKDGVKAKTMFVNPDANLSRVGQKVADATKEATQEIAKTVAAGTARTR